VNELLVFDKIKFFAFDLSGFIF